MVKVMNVTGTDKDNKSVCNLFADTKAEVTTGMEIEGIREADLSAGSSVVTAKGEFAFRKSDGSWSWV